MRTKRLLRGATAGALAASLAMSPPVRAWTPFEKNHPLVEKGMTAYEQRRFDEALAAFDEAQKELPNSPELSLNRGDALAQLGRVDEARQAFLAAAGANDPALKSRALYNLGTLEARQGKRKEAVAAFRQALRLAPADGDARHNLETLLRHPNPPPPQQQPNPDGGQPDGGPPDAGPDGGTPDAGPDGGQGDGGTDGGEDGGTDAGQDGGQDGGQNQNPGDRGDAGQDAGTPDGGAPPTPSEEGRPDAGDPEEGSDPLTEASGTPDGGSPESLSEQEAEKLLDSMKQNEKNFQLWRFQKKKPRKPDGKDW